MSIRHTFFGFIHPFDTDCSGVVRSFATQLCYTLFQIIVKIESVCQFAIQRSNKTPLLYECCMSNGRVMYVHCKTRSLKGSISMRYTVLMALIIRISSRLAWNFNQKFGSLPRFSPFLLRYLVRIYLSGQFLTIPSVDCDPVKLVSFI